MTATEWLVNLFIGYAACGLLFAITFVTIGVGRIDPIAKDSSVGFRLIIVPGVAALWPLLFARLVKQRVRAGEQTT